MRRRERRGPRDDEAARALRQTPHVLKHEVEQLLALAALEPPRREAGEDERLREIMAVIDRHGGGDRRRGDYLQALHRREQRVEHGALRQRRDLDVVELRLTGD